MKKILYLFVLVIFTACGNKSNSDSSSNYQTSENESKSAQYADIALEGYITGYEHGESDGWNNNYKSSFTPKCNYISDEEKNNYRSGYIRGYDEGFKAGKAAYDEEIEKQNEIAMQFLEEYENSEVTVATQSTPNTYSSYSVGNGSLHSSESVYGDYYYYEETSDCEEGVVVYEGSGDYYIVETNRGYTVLEVYSGILYEGNKVRGELNRYNFKYLINRNRNSEVRVYIEDYMLSEKRAFEWLGEHKHLKSNDQRVYDENN